MRSTRYIRKFESDFDPKEFAGNEAQKVYIDAHKKLSEYVHNGLKFKKVPELGSLAGWLKIRSFKGVSRMEKSCKTLIFCLFEPIYLLHRVPFPYLYWLCGSVPI